MSELPTEFVDRWKHHADQAPGQDVVYWHMLMRQHPEVVGLARHAQERLATFDGLHLTPLKWLHLTTHVAGPGERFTDEQREEMLRLVALRLAEAEPITVTIGRVFYHPQAIVLGVEPRRALDSVRRAVQAATEEVNGPDRAARTEPSMWAPHITLCYSTTRQPAAPIIAQLGHQLPPCTVSINAVSLVIQRGPERLWDWQPIGTVQFGHTQN